MSWPAELLVAQKRRYAYRALTASESVLSLIPVQRGDINFVISTLGAYGLRVGAPVRLVLPSKTLAAARLADTASCVTGSAEVKRATDALSDTPFVRREGALKTEEERPPGRPGRLIGRDSPARQ